MEIRELRPEEYEEAGRVTALAYHEFADFGDPDWVRYLDEIADIAGRASHTIVLGAVDGDRVLGTATIEYDDQVVGDDDPPFGQEMANLRMLGVDPRSGAWGWAGRLWRPPRPRFAGWASGSSCCTPPSA